MTEEQERSPGWLKQEIHAAKLYVATLQVINDKMLEELELALGRGSTSMERVDTWLQHRLYQVCSVENCEWCEKEGRKK